MLRPTTSHRTHLAKDVEIHFNDNAKKQQEQIDIFYKTGRRIHKVTADTMYMKEFRSSPKEIEYPDWNHSTKYGSDCDRGGQRWKIDSTHRVTSNRHIMSRNASDIEPGYKGIMALDLTDIPHKFRKQAIDQHHHDIGEYKREQAERPERSRYENTVERAQRIHHMDAIAADKRRRHAAEAQRLRDERMTIGRRKFIERETMIMDAMANDKTDK